MARLAGARKRLGGALVGPAVRALEKAPFTPNQITVLGFAVTAGAAVLIALGHLVAGGLVVLAGGFLDIVDGALARRTGRVTRFGGVLDSTLDRLAEGVLFLGMLWLVLGGEPPVLGAALSVRWSAVLVLGALLGSLLVSYVRARAETAGVACTIGVFTRAERVVVLVLGLLVGQLIIALGVIAVGSFITAGQRILYVYQQTRQSS